MNEFALCDADSSGIRGGREKQHGRLGWAFALDIKSVGRLRLEMFGIQIAEEGSGTTKWSVEMVVDHESCVTIGPISR